MRLHRNNERPATPIKEIEKWGTEKQVSAFIEDSPLIGRGKRLITISQ